MAKLMKTLIVVTLILTVVYKNQAEPPKHLHCWHCSSDTIGSEDFCSSEFKEQNIPTDFLKEHNWSVVRKCNSTINSEHERPVCRKTIEELNGKTIIKRFCYYTNKSDPLDHCNSEPAYEKNARRVFCQDCLSDKCNGAHISIMIGSENVAPLTTATIISLIIAKIFLE